MRAIGDVTRALQDRAPDLEEMVMFVAVLHGQSCPCDRPRVGHGMVVGPFTGASPTRLLGWAHAQCPAGVIARMVRPSLEMREAAGAI